jgi:hypothetical protein
MKDSQIADLIFAFIETKVAYQEYYLFYNVLGQNNINLTPEQSQSVLKTLQEYGIIQITDSGISGDESFIIKDSGKNIVEKHKTFSNYISYLSKEKEKDDKLKNYQINEYEYKAKLQDQEDRIRNLTEHNLWWDSVLKWKWIIIFCLIGVGELIGEFLKPIAFFLRLLFR